jgi:hypothetical protein
MGLDMYAYTAAKAGQSSEYWNSAQLDLDTKEFVNPNVSKPREIAYWRKHPNLHGWMEQLWRTKKHTVQPQDASEAVDPESDIFNGIELELTREDIDRLEQDILDNNLPSTTGFFFGTDADEYYKEEDLQFVKEARAELFLGLRVFYNSSW